MCGIAGIIAKDKGLVAQERLKRMTDVITHRGPDGEGQWISSNAKVGLGHRRLSIIDLSHEADQPMHYLDRYTIVFNGEIYNYIELKETLLKQGYPFRTASDTEVLMALYHRDGEQCLQLLDGMFSFVLYDEQEQILFCARDRFGEKPFFYSHEKGKHFYFGSEMKCLWAGGIAKKVNEQMIFNYLAYGTLDNHHDQSQTFFEGCTRLPHAHCLLLNLSDLTVHIKPYYNIRYNEVNQHIGVDQAAEQFREIFYTSVKRRLRSDVTVGSSLSGGLDSSLVVCIIDELKKGTAQKQNTFSAVFPGFKKDERKYMDYVIAKTNVEPHFVTPTDESMIADLPKVCWHQEEPFGSASIYVQYRVMQLAKEHQVTVLLDGQGADELLAGYHGYYTQYFAELKSGNPAKYQSELNSYHELMQGNQINPNQHQGITNKVKQAALRHIPKIRERYEDYKQLTKPFFHKDFYNSFANKSLPNTYHFNSLQEALYHSTFSRGLQELLRYADRNSMAHSREVRLPFLSHELVDFLFTLPSSFKIHQGWTKWIMRHSFNQIMPPEITWRKDKIGYEPPQKSWMDHPQIHENIVTARESMVQMGILSPKVLNRKIESEESNISRGNNWRLLMCGHLLES